MKTSQNRTLYELLDVASDASPYEIRHAYEEMHELYSNESLGSYSFFTEPERKEILAELDRAYLALIDSRSRSEYDRELISQGRMNEDRQYRDKTKTPVPFYLFKRDHSALSPTVHADTKVEEDHSLRGILDRDTITGADLKTIRGKKGFTLEHISLQSKVTMAALKAIEEDRFDLLPPQVYVKGFLRSYARSLSVDPDHLARAYLKHMGECKGAPL